MSRASTVRAAGALSVAVAVAFAAAGLPAAAVAQQREPFLSSPADPGGSQTRPYQGGGGAQSPSRPAVTPPASRPSQPLVSSPTPAPRVSPPSPGAPPAPATPPPPRVTPTPPKGWPLTRPFNSMIVRPPQGPYGGRGDDHGRGRGHDRHRRHDFDDRVPLFLPLVIFGGALYSDYYDYGRYRDRLIWEDSTVLYDEEGWVDFTLDCGSVGERLWLEIRDGRGRIDWAEIVFDDGQAQVVDFADRSLGPGLYRLLEMRGPHRVEYVRLAAKASTREMRVILRLDRY
ncbi:MAG TPA: hypothetical protein VI078_16955 [bacterium]